MATIYHHPEALGPVPDWVYTEDGRYDRAATTASENEWKHRLAEWCKARSKGKGDLVGKLIYIPFADGAAEYMIMQHSPVALIHLPLGDAWSVPEYQTRGLRISDLRKMACDI